MCWGFSGFDDESENDWFPTFRRSTHVRGVISRHWLLSLSLGTSFLQAGVTQQFTALRRRSSLQHSAEKRAAPFLQIRTQNKRDLRSLKHLCPYAGRPHEYQWKQYWQQHKQVRRTVTEVLLVTSSNMTNRLYWETFAAQNALRGKMTRFFA
jgi:hypothetical protein